MENKNLLGKYVWNLVPSTKSKQHPSLAKGKFDSNPNGFGEDLGEGEIYETVYPELLWYANLLQINNGDNIIYIRT